MEPTVKVEAAFGYSPNDAAPVWIDITQYVKGFDSSRGRNTELDSIDAGTVPMVLDNADGLFTPRKTANAEGWLIRPRTPVRITAVLNGVTYPVAFGNVERWPLDLDDSAPIMTVSVVDVSKVLSDVSMGNSDTGQIERSGPDIYFPMQESEPELIDTIHGYKLRAFWDAYLAAPNPTDGNPQPVITYGADSILPSGSGSSVDLGEYWVEQT